MIEIQKPSETAVGRCLLDHCQHDFLEISLGRRRMRCYCDTVSGACVVRPESPFRSGSFRNLPRGTETRCQTKIFKHSSQLQLSGVKKTRGRWEMKHLLGQDFVPTAMDIDTLSPFFRFSSCFLFTMFAIVLFQ